MYRSPLSGFERNISMTRLPGATRAGYKGSGGGARVLEVGGTGGRSRMGPWVARRTSPAAARRPVSRVPATSDILSQVIRSPYDPLCAGSPHSTIGGQQSNNRGRRTIGGQTIGTIGGHHTYSVTVAPYNRYNRGTPYLFCDRRPRKYIWCPPIAIGNTYGVPRLRSRLRLRSGACPECGTRFDPGEVRSYWEALSPLGKPRGGLKQE